MNKAIVITGAVLAGLAGFVYWRRSKYIDTPASNSNNKTVSTTLSSSTPVPAPVSGPKIQTVFPPLVAPPLNTADPLAFESSTNPDDIPTFDQVAPMNSGTQPASTMAVNGITVGGGNAPITTPSGIMASAMSGLKPPVFPIAPISLVRSTPFSKMQLVSAGSGGGATSPVTPPVAHPVPTIASAGSPPLSRGPISNSPVMTLIRPPPLPPMLNGAPYKYR